MANSKIQRKSNVYWVEYDLPDMAGGELKNITINGFSSAPSMIAVMDNSHAFGIIASNFWVSSGKLTVQLILTGSTARPSGKITLIILYS